MNSEKLYALISLAEFKAVLGIDDRENSLAAFCLVSATCSIEQYCRRRFLRRKHTEYLTFTGEYLFNLREYPVRKVLAIHAAATAFAGRPLFETANLVNPEQYYCLPGEGIHEDIPFSLVLRPPLRLSREEQAIRVRYLAGYIPGKVPADLASACLELAAWNMSRYRGRRIGLTGAVRRSGKDGEHLEMSMPENVRQLLEPYKRRVI
jgi:hypothetical protein